MTIGANTYFLDADGTFRKGEAYLWTAPGYHYYYFDPITFVMVTNRWVDGKYYLPSGAMATQRSIDGRMYWVDENGSWLPNIPYKTGWQNPSQYYQVSVYSVMLPPQAYSSAHCYVTPSSISVNATREECIETMIRRAYDYMGTSYIWGWSNEPGTAVDCSGLVIQCLYATGMATPYDSWRQFYEENYITTASMLADPHFLHVSLDERQRGDLIFYQGHVAIYLGNDRIIEATPPRVQESSMWRNTPIAVIRPFI